MFLVALAGQADAQDQGAVKGQTESLFHSQRVVSHRGDRKINNNHPAATLNDRGGAPTNDECSGAIPLDLVALADCGTAATTGDNSAATDSGNIECDDASVDGFQDVWYTFHSGEHSQVMISMEALTIEDLFVEVSTGGCSSMGVPDCGFAGGPLMIMPLDVEEDTDYWVRVVSNTDYGLGGTFTICIAYADVPANDRCEDVTPVDLAVGSSVTFTGNTVGATADGDAAPGSGMDGELDPTVWHAFTLDECADVTVSYCGTTSPFANVWIFLSPNCPADDNYILSSNNNWTDCGDDNAILSYPQLQPGTYYVPVMWDAVDASGPYTIEVSASACDLYCAASASSGTFEVINNVNFAGINNASNSTDGYVNFTSVVAQVEQGGSYPLTITVNSGYSSDQVLVWIDFNNNLELEESELVLTGSGAGPEYTSTVNVPADATVATARMRIRLQDTEFNPVDGPCGTNQYGQVQDYSVNIDVGSGIANLANAPMHVFPNPGNGDFTVVMPNVNGTVNMEVLDMAGRVVHTTTAQAGAGTQVQLALAGKVAPGSYMLRITGQDISTGQRIVIQ